MPYLHFPSMATVPLATQARWPSGVGVFWSRFQAHFWSAAHPVCMSGLQTSWASTPDASTSFTFPSPPPHAATSPMSRAPKASFFILISCAYLEVVAAAGNYPLTRLVLEIVAGPY